jgi:hypothetical protein
MRRGVVANMFTRRPRQQAVQVETASPKELPGEQAPRLEEAQARSVEPEADEDDEAETAAERSPVSPGGQPKDKSQQVSRSKKRRRGRK